MTLLVATAVPAEADAVRAGLAAPDAPAPGPAGREIPIGVAAVGVGPAAAAAGAARLLALAEAAGTPYSAVLSAGIGGGFAGRTAVGDTVLGTRSIAADLGAESPAGFLILDELGFGSATACCDPGLLARLRRALPHACPGHVLTVGTVTGTAETATVLAARHPDALAEAMEGYGVACAAAGAGLPFAELRTISNLVGPRDRATWRIDEALAALAAAATALRDAVRQDWPAQLPG